MRLHERERQIASAVAVVAVADVVVVVVVVIVIVVVGGVNGCIASASAPEVHTMPGQGRRCHASRGGRVFPRGGRRHRSNPTVVEERLTVVELMTHTGMIRLYLTILSCIMCNFLVDCKSHTCHTCPNFLCVNLTPSHTCST